MANGQSIVRIILNRPEKRNALDRATLLRLRSELRAAAQDPSARCVLLTAEGTDFCSGADLAELRRIRDASTLENLDDARILGELFLEMRKHPLPIIAAVQGRALAGGCGLATASDIVLARADAKFGYPEVNIGFVPAMVMAILRRSVPEKFAFEMLTTGRILTADEARAAGFVNAVYAEEEFAARVEKFAADMAARSGSAVRLTKALLYQMDGMAFDAAIESGAQINAIARMTEDCRKGIDRFLQKD
jgi:methylglutaconyl-CoA hydratase